MIDLPAFCVMGIAREFSPQTMSEIPKLWAEFAPLMGSLPGRIGKHSYGIMVEPPNPDNPDQPCTFLAGVEVKPETEPPAGMACLDMPAARYAVYTFNDHISRFGRFIDNVYEVWVPATGMTPVELPHFELYDERWNAATSSGVIDYYVPVAEL
jgi:AraC family transcriptional regulator